MTARIMGAEGYIKPDERDEEILRKRQDMLNERSEIKSGDRVIFADGVERWVSYVWKEYVDNDDRTGTPRTIQTSDGGSYYLGDGHCVMSGSLYTPVKVEHFTRTEETTQLGVWFFHHDWHQAHSAVYAQVDVPVWTCAVESTVTR